MEIKTKRLVLHPFNLEDAYLLYLYRSQPVVEKYQSFDHYTLSQAKVAVLMEGPKRQAGSYQLGIYLDQWLIGDVFFHFTKDLECFIGYTLDPYFWKQGYGYEAVKASIDYLRDNLQISQFYAYIHPDNIASLKLIEKLGFHQLENGLFALRV